ncbi:N/A [soil metagenome]
MAMVDDRTSILAPVLDPRAQRTERASALLDRLAAAPPGSTEHRAAREELVVLFLPLARQLAARYRNRGEPIEDLVQVATIGVLKAVDGFDPARGSEFTSYAVPTIVGEIKRHFRDHGWTLRVARRLKELKFEVDQATLSLTNALGRTPSVTEIATHLGCTEAEVGEAMMAAKAYGTLSLTMPMGGPDSDATLMDVLGGPDEELGAVDDRETLRPLVARLAPRERRIIALRFYANLSQARIAEQVGLSQMHVSRLLARSLAELRAGRVDPEKGTPPVRPRRSPDPDSPAGR